MPPHYLKNAGRSIHIVYYYYSCSMACYRPEALIRAQHDTTVVAQPQEPERISAPGDPAHDSLLDLNVDTEGGSKRVTLKPVVERIEDAVCHYSLEHAGWTWKIAVPMHPFVDSSCYSDPHIPTLSVGDTTVSFSSYTKGNDKGQ